MKNKRRYANFKPNFNISLTLFHMGFDQTHMRFNHTPKVNITTPKRLKKCLML